MTAIDARDREIGTAPPDAVPEAAHDPHLAHHWDTPVQQFEAAKLGMWLFLATEVLLFGGLFCLYAVLRHNHPEIFAYGSQFLDTRWGAVNTSVLILSSMTMAIGVTAAQRGQTRLLIGLLMATFMGGATFMAIKYVEYHHKLHDGLVWGVAFYDRPSWVPTAAEWQAGDASGGGAGGAGGPGGAAAEPYVPDAELGGGLWMASCRSCHGARGEGMPGQGKDLRTSEWVAGRTDDDLLGFLKVGRLASDPLNTTGVQMPPRGGNPLFSDNDLRDIIAFVRTLTSGGGGPVAIEPGAEEAFYIPRWVVPEPPQGPPGFDPEALARLQGHPPTVVPEPVLYPHHSVDPERPANAHLFFGIYFCMTGLHGLHVLIGMAVLGWLAVRAILGHFGPGYYTPVDLGGLYWHVVDLIWIFLFPLFYLI